MSNPANWKVSALMPNAEDIPNLINPFVLLAFQEHLSLDYSLRKGPH